MKAGEKILVKILGKEVLYEVKLGGEPFYGGLSFWDDGNGCDLYLDGINAESVWVMRKRQCGWSRSWARASVIAVGRRLVKLGLAAKVDKEPVCAKPNRRRIGMEEEN